VVLAVLGALEAQGRHPENMRLTLDRDGTRLYGRIVLGEDRALKEAQREALRESRKDVYTGIDVAHTQEILARAGLAGAFAEALTIRHANDRSMSLHIAVAAEFFVCNNLAVSHQANVIRRRHTGHDDWTDLANVLTIKALSDAPSFELELGKLQDAEITDGQAKAIFWDIMTMKRRPVAPKLIERAAETYFTARSEDVERRSLLSVHQALSRQLRGLGERREAAASQQFMALLRSEFAAMEPTAPSLN
jgi:RecB family exonuclease